jgi:hypothetical protein
MGAVGPPPPPPVFERALSFLLSDLCRKIRRGGDSNYAEAGAEFEVKEEELEPAVIQQYGQAAVMWCMLRREFLYAAESIEVTPTAPWVFEPSIVGVLWKHHLRLSIRCCAVIVKGYRQCQNVIRC